MDQKHLFEDIKLSHNNLKDSIDMADITEQKIQKVAESHSKHQVFAAEMQDKLLQLESMDNELTKKMQNIMHHKKEIDAIDGQLSKRVDALDIKYKNESNQYIDNKNE